jgi:hypothetical protein
MLLLKSLAWALAIWALVAILFLLGGCTPALTEKTQLNPAWAAAWACRCDSCCQRLDDLEVGRLETVQIVTP